MCKSKKNTYSKVCTYQVSKNTRCEAPLQPSSTEPRSSSWREKSKEQQQRIAEKQTGDANLQRCLPNSRPPRPQHHHHKNPRTTTILAEETSKARRGSLSKQPAATTARQPPATPPVQEEVRRPPAWAAFSSPHRLKP